jgi:predicted AAA+ superfamily ATPase
LNPVEFYRRTYLTEGLSDLLKVAMQRLSQNGGDPVVELQTNFGGGKTHSMLALFHLFDADDPRTLVGVEGLMKEAGIEKLPKANRAVLVGTALSAAEVSEKSDGTVTRTLWGEMAWQLGGAEGYQMVAESDAQSISPGSDILAQLFKKYSPCLILIDEWVAYFRGIYSVTDTAAGSFETNLTFAQALTEAASATEGALVVAGLPASQIEIGGQAGQEALDRLKNTFSRIQSSWRPASADEGFEIVRRRLFDDVPADNYAARDAAIRSFSEMYRSSAAEFPHGCGEEEYKRRMQAAYPIHPEVFERLYNDWGGLDKFQRTRGVLRLMASVIHALWERGDGGLMILPSSIPMDHGPVEAELVRYLDQSWNAVIAKDIDGTSSVPLAIDNEVPNLGRYSATRRVARTIYMGSAPTFQGKNPGIDDRRIRLGCAQPGETVATFGDALRRLADRATYLYQDGSRYWFSTQPSVARLADDRAAQQDPHDVDAKLVAWLKRDKTRGEFSAVHIAPDDTGDVPDEMEARLVVLGPDYPHAAKANDSRAIEAAQEMLNKRGTGQRIYKNMLVFVAPDVKELPNLRQAMRLLMAWTSIVDEHEALNLDPLHRKQAESKKKELEGTVAARIRETWLWALVPDQPDPQNREIEWVASRLQGQDELALRASKKLMHDDVLLTRMGPARLKLELDKHLWTNVDHLNTRKLWEWMASYLYLPRLKNSDVLLEAIRGGVGELVCDNFAYAGRYNDESKRYEGLILTGGGMVVIDDLSVVIKPDVAKAQQAAETEAPTSTRDEGKEPTDDGAGGEGSEGTDTEGKGEAALPRRFFATVEVDADRAARDVGKIAEEVLQHLTVLPNSKVKVTIEIEADIPDGVAEDTQRVVMENCQTLKFRNQGFEES